MLQAIINKALSLDPFAHQYLTLLNGKKFTILCMDIPKPIYFMFENNKILFSSSPPEHIDVNISSDYTGFLKYAINKNITNIKITGDMETAKILQRLYLNLDIDWEEELSNFMGDILAHQTMKKLRQLRAYTNEATTSLTAMITEYLQEETVLLPTRYEVNNFLEEIDDLRLRADRLEARIKAYENI